MRGTTEWSERVMGRDSPVREEFSTLHSVYVWMRETDRQHTHTRAPNDARIGGCLVAGLDFDQVANYEAFGLRKEGQ